MRGTSGSRFPAAGCPAPRATGHGSVFAIEGAVRRDRVGDFPREGGKLGRGGVRSVRGERPHSRPARPCLAVRIARTASIRFMT